MTDILFVYVTHPNAGEAASLGSALVEKGLAACVNILPEMQTIYRWQGRIETGDEAVMIVKTRAALLSAVQDHILARHPYECPCVAALPVTAGNPAYFDWIAACTPSPPTPD